VQQHDRWPLAAKLEVNADAVGVHPGHGLPPWLRGIETWMPAKFNMAAASADGDAVVTEPDVMHNRVRRYVPAARLRGHDNR
jgi:hypothetical protein